MPQAHDGIRKDLYKLLLRGKTAIRTMMTIFPVMGERRQQQIQKMLDLSDWETEPFLQLTIPERNSEAELYWLAGVIEGEGTFTAGTKTRPNASTIRLWMTDEDIVARVANIWNTKCYRYERGQWKTAYFAALDRARAVEWMQKLRPLMGSRRQAQIDRAINNYDPDYERKGRIKGNITKAALEPDQVREIRRRLKNGEYHQSIADSYHVKKSVIADISCGRTWAWFESEEKETHSMAANQQDSLATKKSPR